MASSIRRLHLDRTFVPADNGGGLLLNIPLPAHDTVVTITGTVQAVEVGDVSHSVCWMIFYSVTWKARAAVVRGNNTYSIIPVPEDFGASFGFENAEVDLLTNTPGEIRIFGDGLPGLTVHWSGFLDVLNSSP